MIGKMLILFGLVPIAAYWVARYFFYEKARARLAEFDCRVSTEDFAKKISYLGKIPRGVSGKRTAPALAEISLAAAYEHLKAEHPQPVRLRQRADMLSQIILPLSLLIAVFAVVVGRNLILILAAVVLVNALVAIMKFTTRAVASHAATHAIGLLRAARIPRKEDEQSIELCLRALTWK
jgi:hypothetical protein